MYKHLPSFVDFFKGQLPRNKKNLTVSWHEFTEEKRTIVFYEEAETLIKLMEELAEHLGSGRQCVIAQVSLNYFK